MEWHENTRQPGDGSVRHRGGVALLGLVIALALVGCSREGPSGELRYIESDQYTVRSPSPRNAIATGRGCGDTERVAYAQAQRVATFNLRSVTGAERYNIDHRILRREPQPDGTVCLTVQARAKPPG